MHQGVSHRVPALRHQGRHDGAGRNARRSNCASTPAHTKAGVYDPAGVGGTSVIYVLHDITNPEAYGGLPANPRVPLVRAPVEGPAQVAGQPGDDRRPDRRDAALSALRSQAGKATNDRILRYTLLERVMHWLAALTYVYVLLTGLAFYSPHLYWIATILGGAPTSRFWHPWVALVFLASLAWMCAPGRPTCASPRSTAGGAKPMDHYIRNEDRGPAAHRPLQSRPEVLLLGHAVRRRGAAAFRRGDVVPGNHAGSLRAALAHPAARGRRAGDHRRLHHPRLHGHGRGARRLHLHHPRRGLARLGEAASPPLVSSRHG